MTEKVARNRGRSEAGFTMMELLIVIAIGTIMLAATLPMISSWTEKNRLLGASRKIVNDLQYCRQNAISDNKYYKLEFTASQPITYDIKKSDDMATWETVYSNVSLSESSQFQSFAASGNPIFNYKGMTTAGVTITIVNGNGDAKTVTVTLAGKVSSS
ncbi:MAG: prepilin-type N-terminal cleavage/methylation domain-containing protein [Nitrospinae bacterium]|nr:prepilin-type N-terminal cleavage/methylation domain-containing protein [Nitrospinota bacterium]